jgi:hypothetical protein
MSYAHCRQSFLEKFRSQAPVKSAIAKMSQAPVKSAIAKMINRTIEKVNERTPRNVARNMVKRVDKCIEMNGHHFQHLL